ncbi:hypothetical protein [Caulobacter segnis]|uniref:hypothetical protein n=1 Tax=Caulobacter segnis TaxID=88688 RepID=UPI001CBF6911|nr:hypothetical protein [Caulobacter segnis]UAL13148.1 hypothetical protein K8940_13345 [Caulobacter segnis]
MDNAAQSHPRPDIAPEQRYSGRIVRRLHGVEEGAVTGPHMARMKMAQTQTDVRADVRNYLIVSAIGFALGLILGFLPLFDLG